MDIITSYCFASSADTLNAKDIDFAHPLLVSIQIWTTFRRLALCFPSVVNFILSLPDAIGDAISPSTSGLRTFSSRCVSEIDAILQNPDQLYKAEHETIYHHLLNPRSPKKKSLLTREQLIGEAMILMSAGSDTVANASTVGFVHVLDDPRVRKTLLRELREAWPDHTIPMRYEALEKLPYLVRTTASPPFRAPRLLLIFGFLCSFCRQR